MNYNAKIFCEKGECSISSDKQIYGIEITFKGKGRIQSALPESWVLRGNQFKILIFNLDGASLSNSLLFKYFGNIILTEVLVADNKGNISIALIEKSSTKWDDQNFSWDVEQNLNYENLNFSSKNIANVKKTSYIYNYEANLDATKTELYLGDARYNGSYHIPKDTKIPMTGPFPNKGSKPLSYKINTEKKQVYKKQSNNKTQINNSVNQKGGY